MLAVMAVKKERVGATMTTNEDKQKAVAFLKKYKYLIIAPFVAIAGLDIYNGATNQHDYSVKAHKFCIEEVAKRKHANLEDFATYFDNGTVIQNMPNQNYYVRSTYKMGFGAEQYTQVVDIEYVCKAKFNGGINGWEIVDLKVGVNEIHNRNKG